MIVSKHPLYGAWCGMVSRCHNPNNSSYGRYGARGVFVCERWRNFENFLSDMGERPEGKTLDRINPRGPYSPDNCRWATPKEQRSNIDPKREADARKIRSEKRKAYWDKWKADWEPPSGEEIRISRQRLGVTQAALAELLGLRGSNAADTVRAWENGRRPISKRRNAALAALLEPRRGA